MMKSFSFIDRLKNISRLQSQVFDLVIIGGGITGAGVARDAAKRGMKVALVEAQDFAIGTSSRSSKLVHGGIRYLENMEFKLVFEALNERNKLFEMCPHLVHPLRFLIPIFQESRVGMFKMGLGMWLYDMLALFQAPEMHEHLNRWECLERYPLLRESQLQGGYVYSDGYMDDDRLVHETLRSANECDAVIANYTRAMGAVFSTDGNIESVTCHDVLTGKKISIKGRHVISTVGPWTDIFANQLLTNWKKILRPTKGIHLTFKKEHLPLESAVVMGAESRIVFAIPRKEMVIVGTTDTDFSEDPSKVSAHSEDVKYLMNVVKTYFPGAKLSFADIISSYAGVRPLVADGSETEGKTSREHSILTCPEGVTFVAGGKYTTYRKMSEEIVDQVLREFSLEDRVKFGRSSTYAPLNRETEQEVYRNTLLRVEEIALDFQRRPEQVRLLCERYGAESLQILTRYNSDWTYWQIEAAQAIENTMCMTLEDFYYRRVPLFLSQEDHGLSHLDEIAAVFKSLLRLNEAAIIEQKNQLLERIKKDLYWKSQF